MIAQDNIHDDLTYKEIIEKIYYWDYVTFKSKHPTRSNSECSKNLGKLLSILKSRFTHNCDFIDYLQRKEIYYSASDVNKIMLAEQAL